MLYVIDAELPSQAKPLRLDFCGVQWLLERDASGVRCLAIEGGILFEGLLGLPESGGRLRFAASALRHPVELTLAKEMALAPGGQLRGYVDVPLDQRLLYVSEEGSDASQIDAGQELVLLREPKLRLGWRDKDGYYHPWTSEFRQLPRYEAGRVGCKLWLRMRIKNQSKQVQKAKHCRINLEGMTAQVLRGMAFGPGLDWSLGPGAHIHYRELPELGKKDPDSPLLGDGYWGKGEAAS